MLWRSLGEPLVPGPIVHRRPGRPAQMGSQHHVTGSHARTARPTQGLLQVHLRHLKKLLQLLSGQEHALIIKEPEERHALRARDVTRLDPWGQQSISVVPPYHSRRATQLPLNTTEHLCKIICIFYSLAQVKRRMGEKFMAPWSPSYHCLLHNTAPTG